MTFQLQENQSDRTRVNLVFVVGAPRSGTTLLQNLIACHPDAGTAPETHLFIKITPSLLYERNLPPIGKRPLPKQLRSNQINRLFEDLSDSLDLNTDLLDWSSRLGDHEQIAIRDIVIRFFSTLSKDEHTVFIEKSPPHVYFTHEINAIIPEAKIINIVRDPRDVIPSINRMLQQMGKKPRTIYERATIWNRSVAAAESTHLFTVRYEDLVSDPQTVMKRVFGYLDLAYSADYLAEHSRISEETVKSNETWKEKNFSRISSDRIGNFKQCLKTKEIGLIESICGQFMRTYGYDSTDAPFSPLTLGKEASQYYIRRTRMLVKRSVSAVSFQMRGNN